MAFCYTRLTYVSLVPEQEVIDASYPRVYTNNPPLPTCRSIEADPRTETAVVPDKPGPPGS